MKCVGVSTHWNDWRQGVATEEIKPLDGKVAFSVSLVPHRRHNFTTPTQSITPTNLLSYFDSVYPLCLCTWDKSKLIIWEMIQRQLIVIFFFFFVSLLSFIFSLWWSIQFVFLFEAIYQQVYTTFLCLCHWLAGCQLPTVGVYLIRLFPVTSSMQSKFVLTYLHHFRCRLLY